MIRNQSAFGENKVYFSQFGTPIGDMLAMETDRGICLLEFVDRDGLDLEVHGILKKARGKLIDGGRNFSALLAEEMEAYFLECKSPFSTPLDLFGTEFQLRVWNSLTEIPAGMTCTYSQLAEKIGKSDAVRAVGNANARNPVAIVVPCHRVIGANGDLRGYGGGLWRKEWLLQHEKRAGEI